MMLFYDFNGEPFDDPLRWAQLMQDPRRFVIQTWVRYKHHEYSVSTVWIGTDGYPVPTVYETMVFRADGKKDHADCFQLRYLYRRKALTGHRMIIGLLKSGQIHHHGRVSNKFWARFDPRPHRFKNYKYQHKR